MRVKDCMCNNLVKASPETSVAEAAKLMNSNQIGCLPICSSEDKCVGFVTDRDIITRAAADVMANNQVRRLPVLENGKVIGVLTIGDIAQQEDISCECVGKTFEDICGCHNF